MCKRNMASTNELAISDYAHVFVDVTNRAIDQIIICHI
jgi:hypothetical protein